MALFKKLSPAQIEQPRTQGEWSELLEYAESVREKLVPTLMKLPAKDLRNSADKYQIVAWFLEFAWDHEEDHRDRIREWQKNQS